VKRDARGLGLAAGPGYGERSTGRAVAAASPAECPMAPSLPRPAGAPRRTPENLLVLVTFAGALAFAS
jgi:hypothetical protein